MEDENKKIDESWKDSVEKEKQKNVEGKEENKEEFIPEANFAFFVTTLGIQVAIALGEIPNPLTNQKEENLNQAKYLIDILDMLKEKTKNNLTKEEADILEGLLYDIHLKFVAKKERINL